MRNKPTNWLLLILSFLTGASLQSADQIDLELKRNNGGSEIGISSQLRLPLSSQYSEYTIFQSTDLQNWQPITNVLGEIGASEELLRLQAPSSGANLFFKVEAGLKLAPEGQRVGDSVFGYATQFSRQLKQLGQLPINTFVDTYALTNEYLSQISFNPTNAEFWSAFNLSPAVHNATNSADPRLADFRLNTNEFAVFQTNGFVVSPRLGSYSFADSFYRIFTDDLPVFFSTDAALHAWHRTYMGMLEELEETYLAPTLQTIITGMANQVSGLNGQVSGTALATGLLDADYFLSVARSLITGTNNYGSLGQTSRIQETLTAITNLQPIQINLFGTNRLVDFSQFQVRGHYDTSTRLQKYFRATMWCSLADFRFTGSTNDNSRRELSGTVALHFLMSNSGQFANWQKFNSVIELFVGLSDSLNFAQLSDLLSAAGIASPANFTTNACASLHSNILSGSVGTQDIRSGYFYSPLSRQQIKLPRSFAFNGQRFVIDSWAMSKTVFDDIIWDTDGVPGFEDKVLRRVPSALDVAFSTLQNDQIVPELAARITSTNGHAWRDGLPYQHNLAAVRNVVDAQDASFWTNNIYTCWLNCLRALSSPTTGSEFPEVMRTRPWAMKTLNTQLASWTELRHDTVLYAKQSYSGVVLCSYPDGFVEPQVEFWAKLRDMALRTRDIVATLPKTGSIILEPNNPSSPNPSDPTTQPTTNSIGKIYTNRVQHLTFFADTAETLRNISIKELDSQPLTTNETSFLQNLVENMSGYGGVKTYSGWYPQLFYRNVRSLTAENHPSDAWDALVTDVHTDPPEMIFAHDPGSVLHQGVGNVHLMMVAIDRGPGDIAVYAGPILSHYEFELGSTTRKTDNQWKNEIRAGTLPPQPEWTRGYLVPGAYTIPFGY